ncbi:hypothetical protein H6G80_02310 [Nostoc sp. FACHB-87]|uniref:hypothetical protein n=1 Tax=Nostocales TaxID=1161 RepID=UPI001683D86B|nr:MULTISPECIES: hypothetical protein [Nostocales]MBD2297222.1 hypothetical protein [Nostoc sp. FACHB-190]MBD2452933.1 hypothetical protein [Nostoc sp. FACHB-87]MBD2474885.1 hypothetical protein [Anabaena sp. FACHB-83]MBD2488227.1 hypothetical protein [Aulosira sp. FACHB-615]
MSNKFITSNLVVDLSTAEQQLLSGGQGTGTTSDSQPTYGGQPSGGQSRYPSSGYNYPTYICRPVYGNESGEKDD